MLLIFLNLFKKGWIGETIIIILLGSELCFAYCSHSFLNLTDRWQYTNLLV